MPKFVTIGYGDEAGYDRTAPDVRNAAHAHDRKMAEHGALIGIARKPMQVRNPDAKGIQTDGPTCRLPCRWRDLRSLKPPI